MKIAGTLRENRCTFMIISREIRLRMRNVSDKICKENQNTHFVFNNSPLPPPKIVPFVRKCGKIWYSRAGHRWQYTTAHAYCTLHTLGYRHTLRIFNTYCFSTATKVTRTRQKCYVIRTLPVSSTS